MGKKRISTAFFVIACILSGCAALLPSAKEVTKSRWKTFEECKASYDRVTPSKTTARQLKTHGFDLYSTPNLRVLNYIDIAVATQSITKEELDVGLQMCLNAKNKCRAYEFNPSYITSERYGNFWIDLFNFKRQTKDRGWRFKATFVLVDDVVVEKHWSGDPNVALDHETRNPLGPFQEFGGRLINLIPTK
jgi:hypothetical protein